MVRKASTRWQTVGPRPKTKRDRQDIRRLLRAAGSRTELIRWIDQDLKAPPIRGRPRNVFFNDFSVSDGPARGLYLMRFRLGGAPMVYCALVCPRKRGVKPPKGIGTPRQTIREIVTTIWRGYKEMGRDKTLSPAGREALSTSHLGKSLLGNVDDAIAIDAITRRLFREFRKATKAKGN